MATRQGPVKSPRPKENGVALVLVLMMALILSVVSAGIIFVVQTDTAISTNFKYANEAFHVADAGIQSGLNWFTNSYTPHLPVSDYTATTTPVQYSGQVVLLAGQQNSTSNFPDSTTVSNFVSAFRNQGITADSNNQGSYSINAKLLRARQVNLLFGGTGSIERWRLDAQGFWGGSSNRVANVQVSAIIENPGYNVFDTALWGKDFVNMTGTPFTDSYDSSLGPYGGTNIGSNGSIGTNGSISLGGSTTVNGNSLYMPPGTYSTSGGGHTTGDVIALVQARTFPPIPTFTTDSTNNITLNGNASQTINPGMFGTISLNAQAQLTLNPGTYYMDTLSSSSQSAITITGPTVIYISNLLSVGAGGFVNTTTDPKSLIIYDKGTAAATLWAASHFYGLVYAPNAAVSIGGGGDVFGSLVGQNISMQGNGSVHYDNTLSNFLTTAEPFRIIEWRRGNNN